MTQIITEIIFDVFVWEAYFHFYIERTTEKSGNGAQVQ